MSASRRRKSTGKAKPKSARKAIFWLILAALPFLFFVLLEIILRLAQVGQSYPLFIPDPAQPGFTLVNPNAINRYFARPELAPPVKIESTYFTREKRPDALRIVIQGESSAAGYPYGLGASLAGVLQQRLQNQFPDRYVEVIQTAMAAVNTYTLLDFSDDILKIKPDAVVIYTGHNEYLGVMGVGSAYASHSRAATLLMLKLKDLRIYQALQNIYMRIKQSPEAAASGDTRTLMAKVAREKNIAIDSALYQQGLEQFEGNMSMLLTRYRKAGIPVYLGTIASNLRDHPPFNSGGSDPALQSLIDDARLKLEAAITAEQAQQLIAPLTLALAEKQNAMAAYRLGQLFDASGDYSQAKIWYSKARDWDQLRFRAPAAVNDIIKKLATQPGVFLVSAEEVLAQHSPQQIIGKQLMLEHLHPNVEGYFWLGDSYFQQLLLHLGLDPKVSRSDSRVARQQMPVLPAEDYTARVSIERLLADYPFAIPARPVREIAIASWHDQLGREMLDQRINWLQMVQQSIKGYQRENNIAGVATAAALLADARPQDADLNYFAGTQLIQAQRLGEAIRVLQRSLQSSDKNTNALLALAHARILSGNYPEGERLLDRVLTFDPANQTAVTIKQQLIGMRKSH